MVENLCNGTIPCQEKVVTCGGWSELFKGAIWKVTWNICWRKIWIYIKSEKVQKH